MLKGINGNLLTLRWKYSLRWKNHWPWSNSYLRELTQESSSVEECLTLMRESHEIENECLPQNQV